MKRQHQIKFEPKLNLKLELKIDHARATKIVQNFDLDFDLRSSQSPKMRPAEFNLSIPLGFSSSEGLSDEVKEMKGEHEELNISSFPP